MGCDAFEFLFPDGYTTEVEEPLPSGRNKSGYVPPNERPKVARALTYILRTTK